MNVALIHYHLRAGGVSSVLRAQAKSLVGTGREDRIVVLAGSAPARPLPVPFFLVPELDYLDPEAQSRPGAALLLADAVERALARGFPGACDLLHVHNPLIKKHAAFLEALQLLKTRGHRLLLQVHDLAEDFRPEVYEAEAEYPGGCAYAAINGRDRDILVASGLEASHVHLLPNPVAPSESFEPRRGFRPERERGRRSALYPVRAIRRKNLGETLLLSRFLPERPKSR